jgi:Uma2 family endonuclease
MTTATHTPPPKGNPRRNTVVTDDGPVTIPDTVVDIDSFREWLDAGTVPEKAKTWFIDGEVWVDMSKEQLDTHVQLKGEILVVLWNLVKVARSGRVYPDGVLLTHREANLSGNPDLIYVSDRCAESGRVRRVPGKEGGHTELQGSPDMVLEVVSDSSERKDNQTLLERYWEAGIPEYWVVDGRGNDTEFTIYKYGPKGYVAVRKQAGWLKSPVFGKSFRLVRRTDRQGNPEFTLEVK